MRPRMLRDGRTYLVDVEGELRAMEWSSEAGGFLAPGESEAIVDDYDALLELNLHALARGDNRPESRP